MKYDLQTIECFLLSFLYINSCAILAEFVDDSEHCLFKDHPNLNLLDFEHCGNSYSDRIIGGQYATLGQFPWMARIGLTYNNGNNVFYSCGGSIINKLYVVSAAHCVVDTDQSRLRIRLGEYDARTEIDCNGDVCAPKHQDFKAAHVVYHKGYTKLGRNDIALIRLDRPAELHDYVSPICLPCGELLSKALVGTKAEVAGWGITKVKTNEATDILKYVQIPIIHIDACRKAFNAKLDIGGGELCGGAVVGEDSCGGDSGGPLMQANAIDGPPKYFLVGVVSFGPSECGSKYPAIYTHIPTYLNWILDHMQP